MSEQVDPKVAAWMAKVASALDQIGPCVTGYGEFVIDVATICFDGEEVSGYAVVMGEFGTYALRFDAPTTTDTSPSDGAREDHP